MPTIPSAISPSILLTLLLGMMTAVQPLSTDMYLPSLPSIAVALGIGTAEAQLTLSIFLIGSALGQLLYGPLADRYGRKPPLLAGLGLFILGSLGCALAPSIEVLIAARFVQAVGACGPVVLARAVVRDLYEGPRAGQELARMGSIMGVVPAIAPVLGGFLEGAFGWHAPFLVMAALGLVLAGWIITALPETYGRHGRLTQGTPLFASFAVLARHAGYRSSVMIASLCFAGLFAWISGSSFVLQGRYGLGATGFGLAFAVGVAGFVGGTLIGARVVPRQGVARTLLIGCSALALGGIGIVLGDLFGPGHLAEVLAPMALYLAGVGLVMPQCFAAAMQPFPERAGAASSLLGFVQMTFAALVGVGVGHLLEISASAMAVAIAGFGLAALAIERGTRQLRRPAAS